MNPPVDRFLQVAAAHLMTATAPALVGYEQSTVTTLGALLLAVSEEHERAAARRVEENDVLRGLFARAAERLDDPVLCERLLAAAASADDSLRVADLQRANDSLRAQLIELHAHVEQAPGEVARELEAEIWRELSASTERRKLSMGAF